jgi:hypothetical protein
MGQNRIPRYWAELSLLGGLKKMDELVQLVSEKTGLSEEQSKMAVEIVLDYLKNRLPEPVAGQIDGLLTGEGAGGGLGGIAQGLGGLLGGD